MHANLFIYSCICTKSTVGITSIYIIKNIYTYTHISTRCIKPNSVQMFLLISYLPCHFENQEKMGEVVKILGCADFKENPRFTNTQRFVLKKTQKCVIVVVLYICYISVLQWIYSSTTGLYSDWSVSSCKSSDGHVNISRG